MILVPTRELAMQVHHEVQRLSQNSNILLKSAVLFGGVHLDKQIEKLKEKPQIIIGTSDRVLALIKKKKIEAHTVKTFIVDEADKLLDKQSIAGIKAVRKTFMRDTQVVFTSATFANNVLDEIKVMTPDYVAVKTQSEYKIPPNITHLYYMCDKRDKLEILRKMIGIINPDRSIAFINHLGEIYMAIDRLNFHQLHCQGIHSECSKKERQTRLQDFSTGKLKLLIATDLASRGLHVDNVTCIVSVSIAEDPTDYLHRAGRTGRNNADGISICLVAPNEKQFITEYQNKLNINMQELKMKNGEIFILDDDGKETMLASSLAPKKKPKYRTKTPKLPPQSE